MKVTFSARPVIWIEVQGECLEDTDAYDDAGLVRRLCAWCEAERIYPVVYEFNGSGSMAHGYAPDDAERIVEWLREQGAERKVGA